MTIDQELEAIFLIRCREILRMKQKHRQKEEARKAVLHARTILRAAATLEVAILKGCTEWPE